jgi:GTP-binding protein
VLVSPEPFTTRDAIEIPFQWNGKDFRLVDTAGLRRRSKIPRASVEHEGVAMTEEALERADVIIFVLDVSMQLSAQDRTVVSQIEEAGKCAVIAANKWDLVPEKQPETIEAYRRGLMSTFTFLNWAPIAFVSATTGQRVTELLDLALAAAASSVKRLSQPELDVLLQEVTRRHPPTRGKGTRYPKIRSLVQIGVKPLQFEATIGAKEDLHPSYLAFIERMMRERYDFSGCPIRIGLRKLKQRG